MSEICFPNNHATKSGPQQKSEKSKMACRAAELTFRLRRVVGFCVLQGCGEKQYNSFRYTKNRHYTF